MKMKTLTDISSNESIEESFIIELLKQLKIIDNILNNPLPMDPLSLEENMKFQTEKNCFFCGLELCKDRVMDHDHINGIYIYIIYFR
jgi:hypothetical protein